MDKKNRIFFIYCYRLSALHYTHIYIYNVQIKTLIQYIGTIDLLILWERCKLAKKKKSKTEIYL